jgi:hypothetical protein
MLSLLKSNVLAVAAKMCDAISAVFGYLEKKHDAKRADETEKKAEARNMAIEKACDKGTLDDLLRAVYAAVAACSFAGCATGSIEIYAAKSWEGRYSSAESAKAAAEQITLGKGESVWMLSNGTMKRILTKRGESK